ncbi:MAG: sigma-54 interaction domain-containing protein [Gammaproteobacteria bacterium]
MTTRSALPPLGFGFVDDETLSAEGFAELLASSAFSGLLDLMPVAIVITAPDDTVLHFNAGAEAAFGLRRASVLGRPFAVLGRDALLDLDAFLRGCAQGRDAGVVRARHGAARYAASRRVIAATPSGSAHTLYFLSADYATEAAERRPRSRAVDDGLLLAPAIEHLADRAAIAVSRRASVLLLGETGVGKTALARRIHALSGRRDRPFVHVNCGSIPESLFESELFGYERGAFTGALGSGKRGYIEAAAGGTLFLDEIGELPLACQAKLLHFLEDGSVQAVGATQARRADTAVIAATNRDLRALVTARAFRADLFFRISTFTLELPALRGPDAVAPLLDLLFARLNVGREPPLTLAPEARQRLLAHEFTGNVRELKNLLECASILADDCIEPDHLPAWVRQGATPTDDAADVAGDDGATLRERVRQLERRAIAEAVTRHGSKREAARWLGIDVATLIRKSRED